MSPYLNKGFRSPSGSLKITSSIFFSGNIKYWFALFRVKSFLIFSINSLSISLRCDALSRFNALTEVIQFRNHRFDGHHFSFLTVNVKMDRDKGWRSKCKYLTISTPSTLRDCLKLILKLCNSQETISFSLFSLHSSLFILHYSLTWWIEYNG